MFTVLKRILYVVLILEYVQGVVFAGHGSGFDQSVAKDLKRRNEQDQNGFTPLLRAVWAGNVDLARRLIEQGATGRGGPRRRSNLSQAALEIIREQTSLYLPCNLEEYRMPLLRELNETIMRATLGVESVEPTIQVIRLRAREDAEIEDEDSRTLVEAVDQGDEEAVFRLIGEGEDVNEHDNDGYTPLLMAIGNTDLDMVRLLLRRGANPNLPNGNMYPLHWAILRCSPRLVEALLNAGADPRLDQNNGDTLITWARHTIEGRESRMLIVSLLTGARDNLNNPNTVTAAPANHSDGVTQAPL